MNPVIVDAITRQKSIRFSYASKNGITGERVVSPYLHGLFHDRLALEGYQSEGGSGEHYGLYYADQMGAVSIVEDGEYFETMKREVPNNWWSTVYAQV